MQSVDDLLIAADTMAACKAATKELPKTLGKTGVPCICQESSALPTRVTYRGYILKMGERWLLSARRDYSKDPWPTSLREVREFQGLAGIPGFELAHPCIRRPMEEKLHWNGLSKWRRHLARSKPPMRVSCASLARYLQAIPLKCGQRGRISKRGP